MASTLPERRGAFEAMLLRHVAQADEAREVSVDLLTELQAEFEEGRDRPQEQSHADAAHDIAEQLAMPVEKVEAGLFALERQPRVIRKALLRRIEEAWLAGQREGMAHERYGRERYSRTEHRNDPRR